MTVVAPSGLIGQPLRRVEDPRFLTGGAWYVGDMALPGMLHAAFLRSPHAHARILRVDLSPALTRPGVVACVAGEEAARRVKPVRAASKMKGYKATDFPPVALRKVRYAGEAVAAVVAEDRYLAEDAAERIVVEYEPLPPIWDPEAAMEQGSPILHEEAAGNVLLSREFARGGVERAFKEATAIVGDRFRFHRHAGIAMENRAYLADYQPGPGTLTLWSSTQVPPSGRTSVPRHPTMSGSPSRSRPRRPRETPRLPSGRSHGRRPRARPAREDAPGLRRRP